MRSRTAIGLLAALAGTGALAVTASGCGSSGPAALDPVAQAAETTGHAGGARVALSVSMDLGAIGNVTMTAKGALNLGTHEGRFATDFTGLPAQLTSKVGAAGLTTTELFTGGALYVGSPLFAGKLPGGAHWMKLDLAHAAQSLGLDSEALTSGQSNPSQFLEYLKASAGAVHSMGRTRVRGVATTRYRGTIDLRKAAGLLPSTNHATAQAAIDKLIAEIGTAGFPVEVWVDDHGMVRRMHLTMTVAAAGQHLTGSVEEELFDFGPTPSVKPPASGDVFEVKTSPQTSSGFGIG
jgi:hypothetical protein